MKTITRIILMFAIGAISLFVSAAPSSVVDTDTLTTVGSKAAAVKKPVSASNKSYKQLPTHYIKNTGKLDKWVAYYEKGVGHTVFFSKDGVMVLLNQNDAARVAGTRRMRPEILKFKFMNSNPNPEVIGESLQVGGQVNFSINGKTHIKSNTPSYKVVRYKDIYPGIDVKFYGKGQIFEYDFIVKKGADPSQIEVAVQGAQHLNVNADGDLVISLRKGQLLKKKPVVYQMIDDRVKIIAGKYVVNDYLESAGRVIPFSFELAEYDSNYPLTIDPIIDYTSYLGF